MNYSMEELLPIVAELADKYTSKESTSISYERAQQLMEAVIYCIRQCEGAYQMIQSGGVSAKEAYRFGYERLIQKVKETQFAYNEMIGDFCAYGNENYQDTVTKAIQGFFRYYDACFAPQETVITMDYPTIIPITECTGIDAIAMYVEYIIYEQKFLNAFPQEYIYVVLSRFQSGYRKQFYNICNIVLRNILVHMILGKKMGSAALKEDYARLEEVVLLHDKSWMEKRFLHCLRELVREKYDNDVDLEEYLKAGIKDFVTELYVAVQNGSLRKVVVI